MDGPSLGHGARRRPAAVDERHLGRHMRQRVEDVPDAVVRAGCAAVAWSMDRGDWFLPRRIQSNTNPSPSANDSPGTHGDAAVARRLVSDFVLLDVEEVPDSVEVVPDSVEEVPDLVEVVPDSVEEVLDINAVVHCPRCSTFHAGGVFGEACKQARRNARRCSRCGLLHEDYDFFAQVLDDMEKFDCEFYIPDVKKLQMSGNTIILPEEVIEKLEEREKKKQAKNNTKN
jgi:hypothetical protein